MRKILCLIFIIMLMLTCVGCSNEDNEIITDNRFVHIEQGWDDNNNSVHIVVDTETKVMYMVRPQVGITVMLDSDGKPLLYEEGLY